MILVDVDKKILDKALNVIKTNSGRVAKKRFNGDQNQMRDFVEHTLARIKSSTDAESSVKNADLVVEAIVENTKVKQKLFKILDDMAPQKTIFVTNTSSLSVTEIASVSYFIYTININTFREQCSMVDCQGSENSVRCLHTESAK